MAPTIAMMIRTERKGFVVLASIALPYFFISLLYALLVLFMEENYGDHLYTDSTQIGAVFGLAIAFFLGFRMNSAYDRWWEARKIFGELAQNTRSFVAKLSTYINNPDNTIALDSSARTGLVRDLIDMTSAYIMQVKDETHDNIVPNYNVKTERLFKQYNIDSNRKVSNEILLSVAARLEAVFTKDANIEKYDLMQHIGAYFAIYGKTERIKTTPFLKIYGAFTRVMVLVYFLLIPFFIGDIDIGGEENSLEWIAIPILATISTVFLTINRLANLHGEPLKKTNTSIPIGALCNAIVANCDEVRDKVLANAKKPS